MAKLQLLIDSTLSGDNADRLISTTKLFKEINESKYQDIELVNLDIHRGSVSASFHEIITKLAITMEDRFSSLSSSPVFENLVPVLDVSSWPTEEGDLFNYCDEEVKALADYLQPLLSKNGCDWAQIPAEWDRLKSFIQPNRILTGFSRPRPSFYLVCFKLGKMLKAISENHFS